MNKITTIVLTSFFLLYILNSCTTSEKNQKQVNTPDQTASCYGCHTNEEALKELSPDNYLEVFLGGKGFDEFRKSPHGTLGCIYCHRGNNKTDDIALAHSGNFLAHPSDSAEATCGFCHADIVETALKSLHAQGWGMKRAIALRAGADNFENLPESHKEEYYQNCASCHAQCGDCHVNKPEPAGGGLAMGHAFIKNPEGVCADCHDSRTGFELAGAGGKANPDLHVENLGFGCTDCHTYNMFHGDGNVYTSRHEVAGQPSCADCHGDVSEDQTNMFHYVHAEELSCYVCHSQSYQNCTSCHTDGVENFEQHLDFKIGVNPMPDKKHGKFVLLRQDPVNPELLREFGLQQEAMDRNPTYSYASPHNLQRWTDQTEQVQGRACYINCHIVKEGKVLRNKEKYLFESDLKDWEKVANKNIVVDGKLPSRWQAR